MPEEEVLSTAPRPPSIPVVTPDQSGACGGTTTALWQKSLATVVPAIVVIRVCSCSAFDGESPGYSHATGFVVDKSRGIILTNRHVVTPGNGEAARCRRYCCSRKPHRSCTATTRSSGRRGEVSLHSIFVHVCQQV